MGRKTLQCQPDNGTWPNPCTPKNSYQQWSYNGNQTTYTDEVRNQWQQTTDALGRLTKVLEPNGTSQAPSMETDYTYDANNNLLSVNQCGGACPGTNPRTRSFTYDSLSRLLCASNPENSSAPCPAQATSSYTSGTVGYAYDANSNVTSSMDARGITTSYTYDALNRLTQKS